MVSSTWRSALRPATRERELHLQSLAYAISDHSDCAPVRSLYFIRRDLIENISDSGVYWISCRGRRLVLIRMTD